MHFLGYIEPIREANVNPHLYSSESEDEEEELSSADKYRRVLFRLGIDPDQVLNLDKKYELDHLAKQRLDVINAGNLDQFELSCKLSKYQHFASNLEYNENSIMTIKDMDHTTRVLKNNIIRNTGLAQFSQVRFGQRHHEFDDEEYSRIFIAFSDIQFLGKSNRLKCAYIHKWSKVLSQNRQDLGWSEPITRFQMSWADLDNNKSLIKAFTRDVFIDCRFHPPSEISDLFFRAQGYC